ncbi:hypothetical protein Q8A73_003716 [Channa argus]|nr:hypothetical protein Q8A73_003716 [Channa argus]
MGSAPQIAKGTKEGPSPPPSYFSPPPLKSPILQGADSSKIRKPASPPPAQPHFPIITTTKNKALLMTMGSQGPAGARALESAAQWKGGHLLLLFLLFYHSSMDFSTKQAQKKKRVKYEERKGMKKQMQEEQRNKDTKEESEADKEEERENR